ncbi:hypothetical protein BDZ89DRAFT_1243820 [Hymenopellis radicata]|nr:hypothetical protein BDZ89DRAFT_1243820 [Hymenopellis radicata]
MNGSQKRKAFYSNYSPTTRVEHYLDIIDAAGLAFAITHLTQDYSLLHHMSMWWAATYFATARHISNDPVCIQGPGFKNRGKIYTPNGQTIDSMTTRIMQDSKMEPTLVENLIASLDSDIKQEDFRQSPISRAKRAADTASAETRLILKGLVENSVRKRDAAELARRENEELRTRATMAEEAAGKAARESVVLGKVCYDKAEVARRESEVLGARVTMAEKAWREAEQAWREAEEAWRKAKEARQEAFEARQEAIEARREAVEAARKATRESAALKMVNEPRLLARSWTYNSFVPAIIHADIQDERRCTQNQIVDIRDDEISL